VLDAGVARAAPTLAGALSQASEATDESGTTLGAFRLQRLLGRGGMGDVYLAERTLGDVRQPVAIKLLKRGMDSNELLRRFAQERRILAQLGHPHIARFLDGGVAPDGRPYFAMEFVEGRDIVRDARERGLDARARVALLAQVCDAVAYAHSRLVVHRDLKPSNILVDANGQPRVLDFGIAKLLGDSDDATITGTGARVMSPAYAAPEQILGEPAGTATDVYALGVVLFELLTGVLPHRRSGAPGALARSLDRRRSSDRATSCARNAAAAAANWPATSTPSCSRRCGASRNAVTRPRLRSPTTCAAGSTADRLPRAPIPRRTGRPSSCAATAPASRPRASYSSRSWRALRSRCGRPASRASRRVAPTPRRSGPKAKRSGRKRGGAREGVARAQQAREGIPDLGVPAGRPAAARRARRAHHGAGVRGREGAHRYRAGRRPEAAYRPARRLRRDHCGEGRLRGREGPVRALARARRAGPTDQTTRRSPNR
jgi:serine/threonine protein kinase